MKILESNLIKFNEKLYIKRAELIKRNKELNMTQKQVRETYKGIKIKGNGNSLFICIDLLPNVQIIKTENETIFSCKRAYDELMKNNGINKTTTLERMAIYLLNEDKISFEEFCSLKRQHKLKINLCKTKENQLKKFSEEEIKQIQREGDAYECGVEGGLKVHKEFYFGSKNKNYNYCIYDYAQNPQELLKNVKNDRLIVGKTIKILYTTRVIGKRLFNNVAIEKNGKYLYSSAVMNSNDDIDEEMIKRLLGKITKNEKIKEQKIKEVYFFVRNKEYLSDKIKVFNKENAKGCIMIC